MRTPFGSRIFLFSRSSLFLSTQIWKYDTVSFVKVLLNVEYMIPREMDAEVLQ